jgi:hypothetical protein
MIYCESCGHSEDRGIRNLKLWCSLWKISVFPEDMDCGSGEPKDSAEAESEGE